VRRGAPGRGAPGRRAPSAFDQSFALVAQGTVADGAAVDLVTVPVRVRCLDCGHDSEATDALAACPACGGLDLETEGGDELILEAISVEEANVSGHPG
jgi:hydrogenase nickel incorporation protein HypA/HybF